MADDGLEERKSHVSNNAFLSSFALYLFLASLSASLVGETSMQGKDASKGNVDAIKRIGIHPQRGEWDGDG